MSITRTFAFVAASFMFAFGSLAHAEIISATVEVAVGSVQSPENQKDLTHEANKQLDKTDELQQDQTVFSPITEQQTMVVSTYYGAHATGRIGDIHYDPNGQFPPQLIPNIHLSAEAWSSAVPLHGGGEADAKITFTDQLVFVPTITAFGLSMFDRVTNSHDIKVTGTSQGNASIAVSVNDGPLDLVSDSDGDKLTYLALSPVESDTWVNDHGIFRSTLRVTVQAHAKATGLGTNEAKFDNTIEFMNFKFFDQNGNQIYGTLTSELGFTYNLAAPQVVPEPSTFALMGLGAIGSAIGACRRRRLAV